MTVPLFVLLMCSVLRAQTDDVAHFEKRVRPVLLKNCVPCHGPKKQESGFRLDTRRGVLAGGEISGPSVDLKAPQTSVLLKVIRHEGDISMPPEKKLLDAEILAMETWVKAGLPWSDEPPTTGDFDKRSAWTSHWAAQPVVLPPLPEVVKRSEHVFQPIDTFVLQRLEAKGLSPSPTADARTLIRRAHFALTGLPPSRNDVEHFEKTFRHDPRQTMEDLVDSLLESPQYGERWARHWLDVARYADTKGYVRLQEQPNYNYAYTYRDYVVRSFNDDLPYDQFVIGQLAADQIVDGDDNRALAALGFLTLGRRFTGNQHDVIDDRIDVVTRGLMGLTVTCARCHDHKFDPIPTADYYALYGVFASTTEPSDLPLIGRDKNRAAFRGDEQVYAQKRTELDKLVDLHLPAALDMLRADTTRYLRGVLVGRKVFLVPLPAAKGELRQTFVERWVEYLEGTKRATHPVFAPWHVIRGSDGVVGESDGVDFATDVQPMLDNDPEVNSIIRNALRQGKPKSMNEVADIYGAQLTAVHAKWQATVRENPQLEKLDDPNEEQLRQVLYGLDSPFAISPREALDAYLLDAEVNRDLANAYLAFDGWLMGTGQAADRAHVLYDSSRVHEPHIFIRGNPERTGRRVARAAPQVLGAELSKSFHRGSGRLELAQAIVHPQNPLTARVIVNRVWKQHFGVGLVRTTSNFGLRADSPTHPELLDYLAHRFVREGWSIKKLHRWILLSSTWQQSSVDRPDGRKSDPENRWLWRANRRRVDYESLRDGLLMVAGNLDLKAGGPPTSLLAEDNFRRTIYGHIDRSRIPSILRLFDFPSPDTHSPDRAKTTAPQQALYLLNSPFVMRQARLVSQRALQETSGEPRPAIKNLYGIVLGRLPSADEVQYCLEFVHAGAEVVGEEAGAKANDPWRELAQALLISNEFLFID